jgi:hypothetical protein
MTVARQQRRRRSGPHTRDGRRRYVLALVLGGLVLTGCASGDAGRGTDTPAAGGGTESIGPAAPGDKPEEYMRTTLSTALREAGDLAEADIVARSESRLTRLTAPFLRSWQLVQVDQLEPPHPIRFHVAVSGAQVYLLTGDPAAFNRMTAADQTEVASTEAAVELARAFLETTRPAGRLTYLIGSVDDIRFRPGLPTAETRRRDQIVARYRPVIAPPQANGADDGFTVTAYAVQDSDLQRHTLAVGADGHVRDEVDSLVPDLPTPYVI